MEKRRSSEASTPLLQELFTIDFMLLRKRKRGRKVEQEVEREDQGEETAHVNMNMEVG